LRRPAPEPAVEGAVKREDRVHRRASGAANVQLLHGAPTLRRDPLIRDEVLPTGVVREESRRPLAIKCCGYDRVSFAPLASRAYSPITLITSRFDLPPSNSQ
jgi:hypothetical protein